MFLLPPAWALYPYDETTAYGVDSHSGCSGAADFTYAVQQADRVKLRFDLWVTGSMWDYTHRYVNGAVDVEDFSQEHLNAADPFPVWGQDDVDPTGADAADVVYLSSHGSATCASAGPFIWTRFAMGDDMQGTDCRVYSAENAVSGSYGRPPFKPGSASAANGSAM